MEFMGNWILLAVARTQVLSFQQHGRVIGVHLASRRDRECGLPIVESTNECCIAFAQQIFLLGVWKMCVFV